jgi:hypothetical protein
MLASQRASFGRRRFIVAQQLKMNRIRPRIKANNPTIYFKVIVISRRFRFDVGE